MPRPSILTVIIRNKDKVLYNGQAYAVTAINEKGPFDVLAGHESFISLIKDKVTVHTTPKESQNFPIDNGITRIYKDKVYVYVNVLS